MSFEIIHSNPGSAARCGLLNTAHGAIETPVFMPVATQASVKAISQEDLVELGAKAILANSYHLYLRPGTETIKKAGGLHRFMNYEGMILTDSGGFQVLSQSDLREIDDEGVRFKSHIDGSRHVLTPEKVIHIQAELGSDCWTTLDVCAPYPCSEAEARKALNRTMSWTDLSVPAFKSYRDQGRQALLFPILQGSFYPELRRQAAEHMLEAGCDGISLGGFSVGEPKDLTWSTLERTIEALPEDKPRYLMGVGTPEDLWDAVALGVDMFDCVWPTRVARNGQVMTKTGRFNISNSPYREDFGPLEQDCSCFVCRRYSRAYLAHLYRAQELLVYRLISYHNLHLMAKVAEDICRAIRESRFNEAKKAFFEGYQRRSQETEKTT
ncbi:MAG: tRNA guanosine(34) transglycosylase Tgt [Elusimicrobia bacterium]|nr:tRNA guanosine(34) transglycosylase Tgt [Elusimicrobiota bacterium]